MVVEDGQIVERGNFRADAESHRGPGGKAKWYERAKKLDDALQEALRDNLPVRVIINDGNRRKPGDPKAKASVVLKRELDPEPWTIAEYDWNTGAHVLKRGILPTRFVDQFDIEQSEKADPKKRDQRGSVFVRDPRVRSIVKERSQGRCEYCGELGFKMVSGATYLETHHVVPLSEGGADTVFNVVALCPVDHRKAHYSHDHIKLREELLKVLEQLEPSQP
ncbi:HNH endonuclease [Qipengyuania nanhaisediminis]|uniref:5-methylcytosine-specific restriction enzyme A n=1 Tax=Qipengyuania nanhaisediminis TaxID=604088 RepID=A0A1I5LFP2_9SPHN|nr:HNH endonuclease signature motif containing protein [Qipengyuania nanhaisediminis]SFO95676.1 5-methylcytosine-specific restriction enzyme A [Qipengyuania nanhaisediminis]